MKHVKVSLRTLLLSVMILFLAASSVKAEAVFPDEVDTGSETAMSDSEYTDIFSS